MMCAHVLKFTVTWDARSEGTGAGDKGTKLGEETALLQKYRMYSGDLGRIPGLSKD